MLSDRDRRLAVVALDHRFVTREQLDECRQRVLVLGASLEQILLERGLVSPLQLLELDRLASAPPRFAEIARERGLASESQIVEALTLKERLAAVDVHRPVGRILVESAVLSETQVDDILAEQTRRGGDRRSLYRLGEELGRTPRARTHRAVDGVGGREIVFKRIFGRARDLDTALKLKAVAHPNLSRVRDAGADGADLWVVADFVEGLPLYDHVVGSIRLPLDEATGILKQVVAGLGALHAAGRAHGRLVPSNVMLTEMREARLCDGGIWPGTPAEDLRACAELWTFMTGGAKDPALAARIAKPASGLRALADDLDRLDEELRRLAQIEEDADPTLPAPAPAPAPSLPTRPRPRPRRRR